jgi:cellulose synthase/poly-beta-1,6-N-acetylglucosamine synthase-like glycosyltransferase
MCHMFARMFPMYRIIADDGTPLLSGDGMLYEYSRNAVETLHEKNLYHLREDRMLTTLLLKNYPDRSLTFIPDATCWTTVPHTFKMLLSQRRRWINSTVHNMFELIKVNTMCGVHCASMKMVVFIDLIATMILPASYCYAMYLLFLGFFEVFACIRRASHFVCHYHGCASGCVHLTIWLEINLVVLHLLHNWPASLLPHSSYVLFLEDG